MSFYRTASSIWNLAAFMAIAAFASVALWLLYPVQRNEGSNSTGRDANANAAVDGAVQVEAHDDIVTKLVVPLAFHGDRGIALTADTGTLAVEVAMSETAAAVVPGTYTLAWLDGNGDTTLDPGEHAELTVDLPPVSTIHPDYPVNLVIKPAGGETLVIANVRAD